MPDTNENAVIGAAVNNSWMGEGGAIPTPPADVYPGSVTEPVQMPVPAEPPPPMPGTDSPVAAPTATSVEASPLTIPEPVPAAPAPVIPEATAVPPVAGVDSTTYAHMGDTMHNLAAANGLTTVESTATPAPPEAAQPAVAQAPVAPMPSAENAGVPAAVVPTASPVPAEVPPVTPPVPGVPTTETKPSLTGNPDLDKFIQMTPAQSEAPVPPTIPQPAMEAQPPSPNVTSATTPSLGATPAAPEAVVPPQTIEAPSPVDVPPPTVVSVPPVPGMGGEPPVTIPEINGHNAFSDKNPQSLVEEPPMPPEIIKDPEWERIEADMRKDLEERKTSARNKIQEGHNELATIEAEEVVMNMPGFGPASRDRNRFANPSATTEQDTTNAEKPADQDDTSPDAFTGNQDSTASETSTENQDASASETSTDQDATLPEAFTGNQDTTAAETTTENTDKPDDQNNPPAASS